MQINVETPEQHTIRSYSAAHICIGTTTYSSSCLVSHDQIIEKWPVNSIKALNINTLEVALALNPDVILIGQNQLEQCPVDVLQYLSKQRIGLECMSIGAACRTFNLLLSERRPVVAGFILPS